MTSGGESGASVLYRAAPGDYQRWADIFARSDIAKQILEATESSKEFFCIESDLAKLIPVREQTEAFYSMKLGYCIPGVPAQFVYFAKQVYAKYRICNLVCTLMPRSVAMQAMKSSYFNSGYTLLDVLRTFVNESFTPLTPDNHVARCGEWYELWLPQCEMVAAVPESVGTKIRHEDTFNIAMTTHGLMLDNIPLTAMAGGSIGGALGSGFDIR